MPDSRKRKRDSVRPQAEQGAEAKTSIPIQPAPPAINTSKDGGAKKRRKRKNRDHATAQAIVPKKSDDPEEQGDQTAELKEAKKSKSNHGRAKIKKQVPRGSSGWRISKPVGGRLAQADPAFSQDERYLILAFNSAIQVYRVSSSTLVRTLPVVPTDFYHVEITAFSFSATDPSTIYVATSDNLIYLWDWVKARKLGRWGLDATIHGISVEQVQVDDEAIDIVFTREKGSKKWRLSAHRLMRGANAAKTESHVLYKCDHPISTLKVLRHGKTIVASVDKRLILGSSKDGLVIPLAKSDFTWWDLTLPDVITSLDIQGAPLQDDEKIKKKHQKRNQRRVDIVVGDSKGSIFIYEDLLNMMLDVEAHSKTQSSNPNHAPVPRKLHWHREVVQSVAWSLDGNYVISGGLETVLVLWQLDTNRQQFLPHLAAPIERIKVSPTGSMYAVRLSDNSTIVLNTAELAAKANIAGIQAYMKPQANIFTGSADTDHKGRLSRPDLSWYRRVPLTISPVNPSHLLLGVPSTQAVNPRDKPSTSPYLQSFDYHSGRHYSRQALTRTNATNLNSGPDAIKIEEPSICHLQASSHGDWLASIDEWLPPKQDLRHLELDRKGAILEQMTRREVFLKLWAWDKDKGQWGLVTRIDSPHESVHSLASAGRVLALCSDPSDEGLATLGEDGTARIWIPKSRTRNNVVVRSKDAKSLATWTCRHIIHIPVALRSTQESSSPELAPPDRACMAWSRDGSMIAVAVAYHNKKEEDLGTIYFIDAFSGCVAHTRTGWYKGTLLGLAFVERCLVTLSDSLMVWDVVHDTLRYGFTIRKPEQAGIDRAAMTFLTADKDGGSFAIALPAISQPTKAERRLSHGVNAGPGGNKGDGEETAKTGQHTKAESRNKQHHGAIYSEVLIFDPSSPEPIFTTSLPVIATGIAAQVDGTGYVVIDSAANVRSINQHSPLVLIDTNTVDGRQVDERLLRETEALAVDDETLESAESMNGVLAALLPTDVQRGDERRADAPVVTAEQLSAIFDTGPAYSLPPLAELFEQLADVLASKDGKAQ